MKKAFNVAATILGANLTTGTALVFAAGFADAGEGAIGATVNPLALTHSPLGLALTCAFAAVSFGIFKYGYSRLRVAESPQPAPKV